MVGPDAETHGGVGMKKQNMIDGMDLRQWILSQRLIHSEAMRELSRGHDAFEIVRHKSARRIYQLVADEIVSRIGKETTA